MSAVLQALGMGAKRPTEPNAVAALHTAVRHAVQNHSTQLEQPGPLIDSLLDRMTAVDAAALGVRPGDVRAPGECTYVPVVETAEYAIAVFLLSPRSRIPIHDHPGMTVLSRVMRGAIRVTSFDLSDDGKACRSERVLTSADGPVALFPRSHNVHEFVACEEGAAILDVLTPPYDEENGRDCHYFEAFAGEGGAFLLREIAEPDEFECLGAEYRGLQP